jgi:hypothetical protein
MWFFLTTEYNQRAIITPLMLLFQVNGTQRVQSLVTFYNPIAQITFLYLFCKDIMRNAKCFQEIKMF